MADNTAPVLRAKLLVNWVAPTYNADGTQHSETVTLSAVYSADPASENKQWSDATPAASFQMTISNPGAFGKLVGGKQFYVDFIPADPS